MFEPTANSEHRRRLFDALPGLERATTLCGLWEGTLAALRGVGVEWAIYLTASHDREEPLALTNLHGVYTRDAVLVDPFLTHCCATYEITRTGRAYLGENAHLDARQRAVVIAAAEAGFESGLAIPARITGTGRWGGFNLGTPLTREAFEARVLPLADPLRLFCFVVHRRIEEISQLHGVRIDEFAGLVAAPPQPGLEYLSPRERELVQLVARGLSRKECARLCGISPHTAADYVKSAYRKLGVRNRIEAARMLDAFQRALPPLAAGALPQPRGD